MDECNSSDVEKDNQPYENSKLHKMHESFEMNIEACGIFRAPAPVQSAAGRKRAARKFRKHWQSLGR
jgi:hypothetical protein